MPSICIYSLVCEVGHFFTSTFIFITAWMLLSSFLFLFSQIAGLWGVLCFVRSISLEKFQLVLSGIKFSMENGSSQDWLRWSGVGRCQQSIKGKWWQSLPSLPLSWWELLIGRQQTGTANLAQRDRSLSGLESYLCRQEAESCGGLEISPGVVLSTDAFVWRVLLFI